MQNIPSKLFSLIITLFFIYGLKGQNLVPNPSFENYLACPSNFGDMFATGWNPPTLGDSDYYNICVFDPSPPDGFMPTVPINFFGTQNPNIGDGYVGMYAHFGPANHSNEYVQAILTEPLVEGECYEVEMYVSPGESYPDYGISHFGIYLSATPPTALPSAVIIADAQVYFEEVVIDTVNWVLLSGTYIATGGEQYITIGNFFEIGVYDVQPLGGNPSSTEASYYFVDDVRVELLESNEEQEVEAEICEGECFDFNNEQYCTPGEYIVDSGSSCFSSVTLTILQKEEAVASIATPQELDCGTTALMLDASGSSSGLGVTYLWNGPNNFSSSLQNPEASQPGIYTLTVQGIDLCPAETTIEVFQDISEPNISTEVSGIIDCINPDAILIGASDAPNATFNWMGPGVNTNSLIVSANQPGIYTFTVTGENGCTSSEDVDVLMDIEAPDISAEVLGTINCNYLINTQTNIPFDQIDTILWSPTEGLSCLDCLNPQVDSILEMTQYSITIITLNGCEVSDEIILRVKKDREIFIPNVFSPINQDGLNDIFMIYANNNKIKEINTFQIFDRWGEVVFRADHFQANNSTNGWDGRFRNEKLNPGVFVYFAEIEFIDGVKKIYSGDVTLVE